MRLAVISILTFFHYLPDAQPKRIISGREADISEFPYQVSLELLGRHSCGGTIVSEWFIITASHCVAAVDGNLSRMRDLTVRAGASISNMNQGEAYNVSQIMMHGGYRDDPVTNDIALIRVARPIMFSDRVRPIRVAEVSPAEGDVAWVTGYGLTNIQIVPGPEQQNQQSAIEDQSEPRDLRVVRLPIVSIEKCRRKLGPRGAIVTQGMICAGYSRGNRDACKGDSGGPLVIGDRLAGITAWGIGCGEQGLPGVYTNVAHYVDFIRTAMEELSSQAQQEPIIPNPIEKQPERSSFRWYPSYSYWHPYYYYYQRQIFNPATC